jgi:hypothetical protein
MFGKTNQSEHGAIMLLTVAVLVVFFIFAAFAIDLTVISASTGEARYQSRLTALAALEHYFDTKCPDPTQTECHTPKAAAALARAQEVADANTILMDSGGGAEDIQINTGPAVLESGRWYSVDDGNDPCSRGYPCFVRGNTKVNAFRYSGNTYRGISRVFSKIFAGQNAIPVNVTAVASVIPRHGCFLVDISGSTATETHTIFDTQAVVGGNPMTIPRSRFVFFLSEVNGTGQPGEEDAIWAALPQLRPDPSPNVPTLHYKGDYEIKRILTDANYGPDYSHHPDPATNPSFSGSRIAGLYDVDFYRGGSYNGPEPLVTIFRGLNEAVKMFKERAVAGDMACMVFYDRYLTWFRTITLTKDFDYLQKFTDPRQLTEPINPLLGYRPTQPIDGLPEYQWTDLDEAPLAIRHGLFPVGQGFTKTMIALREAMRQFATQSTVTSSSDFIVHIGDGLVNCDDNMCSWSDFNKDGEADNQDVQPFADKLNNSGCKGLTRSDPAFWNNSCWSYDRNSDNAVTDADIAAFAASASGCQPCANTYDYYKQGIDQIRNYARNSLFPARIPLHVILVGDHVKPHTLDVAGAGGKCLTDVQARKDEKSYVLGGDGSGTPFANLNAARTAWERMLNGEAPFYQANADWYAIARLTGGLWGPLRPKDPTCGIGSGPSQDTCNNGQRREYDTLCHTDAQQIIDYMSTIVGQNPYAVVYSD